MQTLIIYGNLQKHPTFKMFIEENPDSYSAHFFIMYDKNSLDTIHVGYYQPDKDLIASFIIEKDDVTLNPGNEIFKKDLQDGFALTRLIPGFYSFGQNIFIADIIIYQPDTICYVTKAIIK